MTDIIKDPTTPSVDIPNSNVTDGGRIKVGAPSADRGMSQFTRVRFSL